MDVILPLPVGGTFTYRVPFDLNDHVQEGIRVVVQFGSRKIYTGLVRRVHENPPEKGIPKYILSVLDITPVVSVKQMEFWEWISQYYMCHLGEVMQAALPSAFKLASETKVVMNPSFNGDLNDLGEKEQVLLESLGHREVMAISDVEKILDQKKVIPLIRTMIDKGIVLLEEEIKEKYKPRTEKIIRLSEDLSTDEDRLREVFDQLQKRAPRQLEILMTFISMTGYDPGKPVILRQNALLQKIDKGESALRALEKKGILISSEQEISRVFSSDQQPESLNQEVQLTKPQEEAFEGIREAWKTKEVVLLHGITSSGKTELYIKLMQEVLAAGKQVLYLLPEIALTAQIINRLKKYFGDAVGVYHSRFNDQEKVEIWNLASEGTFSIIIGARSALFVPLHNLGLIVVDEEHDTSFKQYDPAPRYHGRDAAIYLGQLYSVPVILGSATPSIESYFNARQGKYGLVELMARYREMPLPIMKVVDLKTHHRHGKMKTHFSEELLDLIRNGLDEGTQTILFQNRRGFSLRLECDVCHWMPVCKNCDVTLVYHKRINQLRCHYCGFVQRIPAECPECHSTRIHMKGFGTERVEEDLQLLFPKARIARMDLDTTRTKHGHQQIIDRFENHKIDILVGTQMVTKGLDFDHVRTVAVLNADNMLSYPDFRSGERSFQLMAQVAGRSGRKNKQGTVVVQTWQPKHPVILDVVDHNYPAFYLQQLNERKKYFYPPFTRLVVLRIKHKKAEVLAEAARVLASELKKQFGRRVLGPEYPMVSRIMNWHIKQIMIKLDRDINLNHYKQTIQQVIDQLEKSRKFPSLRINIDVDPL